ncbi:phage major capsid protein [Afifella sp. H1R]|uniref:phage major capsid protein n=1 Tax=Afifella sp. H1R TaxID=2908841 RepID=UPI001F442F8B|nr:phage major capsid protein [Afifella sp. H1R]MCF1502187.1 phage major capsid protein [Afifella sp. H1R]
MTKHYGRQSFALERKDEGGGNRNSVVDEVRREVKSFGDDFKQLNESMRTDLEAVRKLAEDAKNAAERPEIKSQIEALTTSVSEKHAALEDLIKKANDRSEAVETVLKRSPVGGGQDEADHVKHAIRFFETKAAASGNLAWRSRPTRESVDMDGYKAWEAEFGTYLRASDERQVEAKALSVGSNPNGGYLVPTATSQRIIAKVYETSPLRQLAAIETIGTEALEVPVDTDEAGAGWVGEEEARSETSTPQVFMQRIPVHEIYAKPKATQSFLEDASVNVEQWLATKVGDKFSRVEAAAFIVGNGVKKPRGILTYPAGSSGARGTVLQYASGAATAITADAIVAMPFQVKAAYLANAQWLMKRSTVQAVMLLKDGQGQYLWRPGLQAGMPSVLSGYPVTMADDMPAVQAGALPIAFGDFRRAYTIVDRLGITTLRDPYSAKPFVEFYSRKRVGGDVVDFEAYALMVVSA